MSQLGMGVMLHLLSSNEETVNALKKALGKTIKSLSLEDNHLIIKFEDKTGINIFDDGQSCCETRYMSTDDDLSYYNGATFMDLEIKNVSEEKDDWGEHEIQFLEIKTSKGVFTMANHNEHNGYYGGFAIECKEII